MIINMLVDTLLATRPGADKIEDCLRFKQESSNLAPEKAICLEEFLEKCRKDFTG